MGATAALVLADGSVFWGRGFGAHTGRAGGGRGVLQHRHERLPGDADRSLLRRADYTFTFPHIGNVGANPEDLEATNIAACALVVQQDVTEPSNWRSSSTSTPGCAGAASPASPAWTPASSPSASATAARRAGCWPTRPTGGSTSPRCGRGPQAWPGLEGMDLAKRVSCTQSYEWDETEWCFPAGTGRQSAPRHHVVAVDYGAKRNILRCLASAGCRVTVVPATATAEDILRHQPDGVFLSNGPGDPAATAEYAVPAIRGVLDAGCRCSASASATSCWPWRWGRRPTSSIAAIAAPTSR